MKTEEQIKAEFMRLFKLLHKSEGAAQSEIELAVYALGWTLEDPESDWPTPSESYQKGRPKKKRTKGKKSAR